MYHKKYIVYITKINPDKCFFSFLHCLCPNWCHYNQCKLWEPQIWYYYARVVCFVSVWKCRPDFYYTCLIGSPRVNKYFNKHITASNRSRRIFWCAQNYVRVVTWHCCDISSFVCSSHTLLDRFFFAQIYRRSASAVQQRRRQIKTSIPRWCDL